MFGVYAIVTRGFGAPGIYYLIPTRGYLVGSGYTCVEPTQSAMWDCDVPT